KNRKAADKLNQTDDNSGGGWNRKDEDCEVTCGARNGGQLAIAGNDEENRKKDAGDECYNAVGLWSNRGHAGLSPVELGHQLTIGDCQEKPSNPRQFVYSMNTNSLRRNHSLRAY